MGEINYDLKTITACNPEKQAPITGLWQIIREKISPITATRPLSESDFQPLGYAVADELLAQADQPKIDEKWFHRTNKSAVVTMKEKYGIDYDSEVNSARRIMLRSIESLGIPSELKQFLKVKLDHVSFALRSQHHSAFLLFEIEK